MSITRTAGMVLALPVALTALTGAAANPTLTYHGHFDDYVVRTEGCRFDNGIPFTGVWNVRVPDPKGTIAWINFQSRMDWGGRPTMFMFEHESVVLKSASKAGFSASTNSELWGMPAGKDLTFTLDDSGRFVYRYQDEVSGCVIDFTGHQIS